jgi:hypothetical protein
MTTEQIKWHQAFYGAIHLELEDYRDSLEFHAEHRLTTEPAILLLQKSFSQTHKNAFVKLPRRTNSQFCPYNPLRNRCKQQASFRLMNLSAKTAGKHLITPREGFSLRASPPAEKIPLVSLKAPVFSVCYRWMLHTVK